MVSCGRRFGERANSTAARRPTTEPRRPPRRARDSPAPSGPATAGVPGAARSRASRMVAARSGRARRSSARRSAAAASSPVARALRAASRWGAAASAGAAPAPGPDPSAAGRSGEASSAPAATAAAGRPAMDATMPGGVVRRVRASGARPSVARHPGRGPRRDPGSSVGSSGHIQLRGMPAKTASRSMSVRPSTRETSWRASPGCPAAALASAAITRARTSSRSAAR